MLLSIVLAVVPLLAEAAGAPRTFKELAGQVFTLLSAGIATIVALGIVIYIWGIASNMMKVEEGFNNAGYRNTILWGIVIIFVMVSIFGIVNLLYATFFQGGAQQPQQQDAPRSLLNANAGYRLQSDA